MVVNSVISVVYYFAVPRQMIFEPARDESPDAVAARWSTVVVLGARGDRGGSSCSRTRIARLAEISTARSAADPPFEGA